MHPQFSEDVPPPLGIEIAIEGRELNVLKEAFAPTVDEPRGARNGPAARKIIFREFEALPIGGTPKIPLCTESLTDGLAVGLYGIRELEDGTSRAFRSSGDISAWICCAN